MATAELHPPGAVNLDVIAGGGMPAVAGPAPQWSDNSDATYAVVVNDSRGQQDPWAYLPAESLTGTPTSFTWYVRSQYAFESGSYTPSPITVQIKTDDLTVLEGGQVFVTPGTSVAWLSATETIGTPDSVFSKLASGLLKVSISQFAQDYAQQDTYAYEAYVVIDYTPSGGVQPYRARQRLYPIAPGRHWPREGWAGSSGRRVGGYH